MGNWYDDEKRRRRNKDVLEDGESIRVTAMMMDHRRPHLDASRMTLGDIAKLGELPSGIPSAYVESLKPIAQAVELAERLRSEEGESRTADYLQGLADGIEARAFGPAETATRH